MAKLNFVSLYGFVEAKPDIRLDKETGDPVSALSYIHVIRSHRDDHSGKKFTKHDFPLVVSLNSAITQEMMDWEPFDVVNMKGTINTRKIIKPSFCPHCNAKNEKNGVLMYVTPIYARLAKRCETKKDALKETIASREISNMVFSFGRLMTDPTCFKTKAGTVVSQFKIAVGRKYRVVTDDEDIKTDWPWVKTYGKEAVEAKMKLSRGSEIYVDGAIQARTIRRKTKCASCGQIYTWNDRTLELVPYALEYVGNYKTDEMLREERHMEIEEIKKEILNFKEKDTVEADANSEDIDENTVASIEDGGVE